MNWIGLLLLGLISFSLWFGVVWCLAVWLGDNTDIPAGVLVAGLILLVAGLPLVLIGAVL